MALDTLNRFRQLNSILLRQRQYKSSPTMSSLSKVAVLLIASWAFAVQAQTSNQPPSFIIFLVDDLGWNHTSVEMIENDPLSKSDYYETPALEEFAGSATIFSNAYASSAVCSPTRLSLQTGLDVPSHKFTDILKRPARHRPKNTGLKTPRSRQHFPRSLDSIATRLKELQPSYITAHLGKWHLGKRDPSQYGYDIHDGATSNKDGNKNLLDNPKEIGDLTLKTFEFLQQRATDEKPFLLQISHYAVHVNEEYSEASFSYFEGKPIGERHSSRACAAMLKDLDTSFAALIEDLKTLGLTTNTYVVFLSDNGGARSNAPFDKGKTSLREGGIRVPFLISGPHIPKETRYVSTPTVTSDIFHTVEELALGSEPVQQTPPHPGAGVSLVSLLETGAPSLQLATRNLVWHFPHFVHKRKKRINPHSAIQTGGYKLIRTYTSEASDTLELYNLQTDPYELQNIAENEPDITTLLTGTLETELKNRKARMPKKRKKREI